MADMDQLAKDLLDRAQIVLLKPDDVLVFSNIGDISYENFGEVIAHLKEALNGRMLVFFPEKVDLAILRELEADEETT